MAVGDGSRGGVEEGYFLREDEWAQTMCGDVQMSRVDVTGDNVAEVAGELGGDLAGSSGDVVGGFSKAAV